MGFKCAILHMSREQSAPMLISCIGCPMRRGEQCSLPGDLTLHLRCFFHSCIYRMLLLIVIYSISGNPGFVKS
jgi:hypothetical protein